MNDPYWERRLSRLQTHQSYEKAKDREQKQALHDDQQAEKRRITEENNRVKEQIADRQNRLKEQIEANKLEFERKKEEKANDTKLLLSEMDRIKELEKIKANFLTTHSLKEQELQHDLIKRNDVFNKDLALKREQYNFEINKAQQEHIARLKETELKEYEQTRRTQIIEQNKKQIHDGELQYKREELKERHRNSLELEDKKAEIYKKNTSVDMLSHAFKKMLDAEIEKDLLKEKAELLKYSKTQEEIEDIIKNGVNNKKWNKEL